MIIASLFAVSALLALVISKLTHEHIESRDVIDLSKILQEYHDLLGHG
ncbi:hypothetical protein [Methanobrevibacter sp.]